MTGVLRIGDTRQLDGPLTRPGLSGGGPPSRTARSRHRSGPASPLAALHVPRSRRSPAVDIPYPESGTSPNLLFLPVLGRKHGLKESTTGNVASEKSSMEEPKGPTQRRRHRRYGWASNRTGTRGRPRPPCRSARREPGPTACPRSTTPATSRAVPANRRRSRPAAQRSPRQRRRGGRPVAIASLPRGCGWPGDLRRWSARRRTSAAVLAPGRT